MWFTYCYWEDFQKDGKHSAYIISPTKGTLRCFEQMRKIACCVLLKSQHFSVFLLILIIIIITVSVLHTTRGEKNKSSSQWENHLLVVPVTAVPISLFSQNLNLHLSLTLRISCWSICCSCWLQTVERMLYWLEHVGVRQWEFRLEQLIICWKEVVTAFVFHSFSSSVSLQ